MYNNGKKKRKTREFTFLRLSIFFTFLFLLIPVNVISQGGGRWIYEGYTKFSPSYAKIEANTNFDVDLSDLELGVSQLNDGRTYKTSCENSTNFRTSQVPKSIIESGNFTNDEESPVMQNGTFTEQGAFGYFNTTENFTESLQNVTTKIYATYTAYLSSEVIDEWHDYDDSPYDGEGEIECIDDFEDTSDYITTSGYGANYRDFTGDISWSPGLNMSAKIENITTNSYVWYQADTKYYRTKVNTNGTWWDSGSWQSQNIGSYGWDSDFFNYSSCTDTLSDMANETEVAWLFAYSASTNYYVRVASFNISIGFSYYGISEQLTESPVYNLTSVVEFDYSTDELQEEHIVDYGLNLNFASNITQRVDIYAWNWSNAEFSLLISESPISKTTFWIELSADFKNSSSWFQFKIESHNTTDFYVDFDLFSIDMTYDVEEYTQKQNWITPQMYIIFGLNGSETLDPDRVWNVTMEITYRWVQWENTTYVDNPYFEPSPLVSTNYKYITWSDITKSYTWQHKDSTKFNAEFRTFDYASKTYVKIGEPLLPNVYYTYNVSLTTALLTDTFPEYGEKCGVLRILNDLTSSCPTLDLEIDYLQMGVSYYRFMPVDFTELNVGQFIPNFVIGICIMIVVGSILATIGVKVLPKKETKKVF